MHLDHQRRVRTPVAAALLSSDSLIVTRTGEFALQIEVGDGGVDGCVEVCGVLECVVGKVMALAGVECPHHGYLARLARGGDTQVGASFSPGVGQVRVRQDLDAWAAARSRHSTSEPAGEIDLPAA